MVDLAAVGLLAGCVVLCEAAGSIGSVWTRRNLPWFDRLEKPSLTPPGYLIGAIWIILFLLMGVALFLIIEQGLNGQDVAVPLLAYAVQLALNIAWNYFFFGLRSPLYGLMEIVVLWFTIAATIAAFWSVSATAGALLVPYIAWVTIAAALNGSILSKNRNEAN